MKISLRKKIYTILVMEMKRIATIIVCLLSSIVNCYSQADSLSLQVFIEGYASSVRNHPYTKTRPAFYYNYTKANSAGINMALARVHYSSKRFRSNLGLMAGDYPNANLANEAKWARNIYEANIGVKLAKDHPVWLDAGVMPSHIGLESAIGKDNQTATRSIVADNSPYYETGLRLSYKPNDDWYLALLMLTGWQRITVPANQLGTNWGLQVTYTPNNQFTFNSSSFIGKVFYGRNVTRMYSNTYSTIAISKRTGFTLCWDIGLQENSFDANRTDIWYGLMAIFRYQLKPGKWSAALRYERFVDKQKLLFALPVDMYHQFNVNHASINLDWQPVKNVLLRAEANYVQSPYSLFYKGNQLISNQFSAFLIASYNLQLSKKQRNLTE